MTPTSASKLMQAATCIRSCIPEGMMRAVEIGILTGENIRPIYPCGEPGDCILLYSNNVHTEGVGSYTYSGVGNRWNGPDGYYLDMGLCGQDQPSMIVFNMDGIPLYYAVSFPCSWQVCPLGGGDVPQPAGMYVPCTCGDVTNCIEIIGPVTFPDILGTYINDGTGVYVLDTDPTFTLEPCPEFGNVYGIVGNHLTATAYYLAITFPCSWQVQLLEGPPPTGQYVTCTEAEQGLVIGGDQIVIDGVPVVVH